MLVRRSCTALIVAAALTMSCAASASAGIVLVKGKVTGEGLQRPGAFQADVDMKKGRPAKMNFIEVRVKIVCSDPQHILKLEQDMPLAKIRKHGGKYHVSSEDGGTIMNATVSKNGAKVKGDISFSVHLDDVGVTCEANTNFRAKSIYARAG